jgi:hypothetical protein
LIIQRVSIENRTRTFRRPKALSVSVASGRLPDYYNRTGNGEKERALI